MVAVGKLSKTDDEAGLSGDMEEQGIAYDVAEAFPRSFRAVLDLCALSSSHKKNRITGPESVKAVTVDTVSCLPRAHATHFDTGELIMLPVLDSKTKASMVPGAVLSAQRESIKESQLKTVRIHFAEP